LLIRLGHSPDPDDAFMFWGLADARVDPRGFEFEHVLRDIQTLNEWALEGRLEVSAISLHAYPLVQDRYAILPHGASMGRGYGPIVVAREPLTREALCEAEIAVPGKMTTAFLVLRLFLEQPFTYREVPFDAIIDEVVSGRAAAGLLIHEGQLTFGRYGLEHRPQALEYAMRFGRGLDPALTDRFVGMYVNRLTQDYGDEGRQAVEELLARGAQAGAIERPVRIDFVT
jgi:1,4-dihydroxy-6-naphthoate synthase